MELFKAGNNSQWETIKRWINDSDVYMLILGGRYGSIEPTSKKSYTHLEYEYAISQNIPVFATVLSDNFLADKVKNGQNADDQRWLPAVISDTLERKGLLEIGGAVDDDEDSEYNLKQREKKAGIDQHPDAEPQIEYAGEQSSLQKGAIGI